MPKKSVKKKAKKRVIIHKKHKSRVDPMHTAFLVAMPLAILSFIATAIALTTQCKLPLTKAIEILYAPFGYSVSTLGLFLGPIYTFVDTFIVIWIISSIYNKFIKD